MIRYYEVRFVDSRSTYVTTVGGENWTEHDARKAVAGWLSNDVSRYVPAELSAQEVTPEGAKVTHDQEVE